MELLPYSLPSIIEVLPALPAGLPRESIDGMLACTFARMDKLAWNMETRTVELVVTSVRKQDITLIARYGIEEISPPAGLLAGPLQTGLANIGLHLPEGRAVSLRLKLGTHEPIEWVEQVATA